MFPGSVIPILVCSLGNPSHRNIYGENIGMSLEVIITQ